MSEKRKPPTTADGPKNLGVFITQGVQLGLKGLSLRKNSDGKIEVSPVEVQLGLNVCPIWLDISFEHLRAAEKANERLLAAHEADNNQELGTALQDQFRSGMQSIVANATALDAYYASVKKHSTIPEALTKKWRKNRTARYKQIAETFRLVCDLKQVSYKEIRRCLEVIYKFRDWAVHPQPGLKDAEFYEAINRGTEWRFVAFNFPNAREISKGTLAILIHTSKNLRGDQPDSLREYCDVLRGELGTRRTAWEHHYGALSPTQRDKSK